jgi:hypothetical protein
MKNTIRGFFALLLTYAVIGFYLVFGFGCGVFSANSAKSEKFDCQVRALQPLVGDVLDAKQLMRDLYTGKASLGAVLANLNASEAEVKKLLQDLHACEPPVELPEGDAS